MNYWLVKSEADVYSYDDLIKDKSTHWDGVRNYAARIHLKAMKKGDLAFIYHSVDQKQIVGIAKITKEWYPDPGDAEWAAVELSAYKKLKNPVTLAQVKANKQLQNMTLLKISRLSVQPVLQQEFDVIVAMSEGK
jgi:predicted RNA-binding protein with PUA-like domain